MTLGNAFIIYGGDTKIEETDVLDDNLYLLNTTTLKWTVANPAGPQPLGRYGHTISTIGSKVYIFGGQLDDYFFDDLVCYDLTTLRQPNSKWQLISANTPSPPSRTNHTMVTFQDKLYLFGGTDGKLWYSDTWCYDPQENTWTSLECSGFIPAPCEGHSATIVGDIMYVFGGRSSQGNDLGTLSALKLTTRKWFTFQNLGPGPSPRSGHSMTAFAGNKILVMGGESLDLSSEDEQLEQQNSTVYILDTSRISYPAEHSTAPRFPVSSTSPTSPNVPISPNGPQSMLPLQQPQAHEPQAQQPQQPQRGIQEPAGRVSPTQAYPDLSRENEKKTVNELAQTNIESTGQSYENNQISIDHSSNSALHGYDDEDNKSVTTFESMDDEQYGEARTQPSTVHSDDTGGAAVAVAGAGFLSAQKFFGGDSSIVSSADRLEAEVSHIPGAWNGSRTCLEIRQPLLAKDGEPESPVSSKTATSNSVYSAPIRQQENINGNGDARKSYGEEHPTFQSDQVVGQSTPRVSLQIDHERSSNGEERVNNVNQALERLKASNSWYESELAAAKDAGYVPSSRPPVDILKLRRVSQRITQDNNESLSERDILLTALSELKEELQNVQKNVTEQAAAASARISEAEQERDALKAENEQLQSLASVPVVREGRDNIYQQKIDALTQELEEHKKARKALVGDQYALVEPDNLRLQNLELEKQLRDQTDRLVFNEHEISQLRHQLEEGQARLKNIEDAAQDKINALTAAGVAVTASQSRVAELTRQLDDHRSARTELEGQVHSLQQELSSHKQQLESSQRELQNHRDLLETANQQAEHSSVALNVGITNIVSLWAASKAFGAKSKDGNEDQEDPNHAELQKRLDDITALHKSHKEAADKNSLQLSRALEQVAELKHHLAMAEQEKNSLEFQLADLNNQLIVSNAKLDEHNRSLEQVQSNHEALQSKMNEYNDNITKELQQKIESLTNDHENKLKEVRAQHDSRYCELEQEYVKSLQYFKNIERALSKTREELAKQKADNAKLQSELDDLRLRIQADDEEGDDNSGVNRSSASMASERLGSPNAMKYNNRQFDLQLRDLRAQVIILQEERDELRAQSLELKKRAINHNDDLEALNQEVHSLQAENGNLAARLKEAEDKANLLMNGKRLSKQSAIDPESGQRLSNFSDELEQIRNQRQKLSSVLNEDE